MTLRVAVPDDFDALAQVQRRAVDRCLRPLYDEGAIDLWLEGIVAAKFARVTATGETIFVAESPIGIVGFSSFHPEMSLLGMWYVDPDFIGQGIGSQLLEKAEQGLAAAGCALATSEASLFARPHFESRGWKAVEEFDKPAFGAIMCVTRMEKALTGYI